MALDLQNNWTVRMEKNLDYVTSGALRQHTEESKQEKPIIDEKPVVWETPAVYLPDEVIIQILEYVSNFKESQYTLASCCRLSGQWYSAAVPLLYASPHLYGRNFDPFVQTIVPSKNLHVRKSILAKLVKVLDMRGLVHQGSKSTTARLLGRTKENLEAFVAPVATFGDNCLAPLSKCPNLRLLDLAMVSESPSLSRLLQTVSHIESLSTFRLPRSAGFHGKVVPGSVSWPPRLENLSLSGGIDAHFMHGIVALPSTLRSLTIEHCPAAKGFALMHLLRTAVQPLPDLEILRLANLPRLGTTALDSVLVVLPGLTKLSISIDYISPMLFDLDVGSHREAVEYIHCLPHSATLPTRHKWSPGRGCDLRTLELTNSGNPGVEDKISPIDVMIALDEGTLPHLRQVRVAKSLLWHMSSTADDLDALSDALKESAIQHEDEMSSTGVWTFDG
ncbi:hypothetical protein DOTSEDRAFT_92047 [Dothistroma septosporum NZE10]|uniref:Uncharacterized protein n=1 Tax=Dothistroma septosporum (strain NZE10 / CBS 128990) TaxID=675120 RepID=M2WI68_DOTSN|nr:hypothetical protein DOTSEDRAFT_92047 [Dothistroma septosporum NZE10]